MSDRNEPTWKAVVQELESSPLAGGGIAPAPRRLSSGELLDRHGARLLFCCSAVSVLYGMLRILGPLLVLDGALARKLPAFAALNLYELSLLVVLALIVLWRKKLSDAPLLVALAAIFLSAAGLALDTLATDSTAIGFTLGAICFALGAAKLGYLRRFIRVRFDAWHIASSIVLLAGIFLGSSVMARTLGHYPCDGGALGVAWRCGLVSSLLAGGLLWIRAVRIPAITENRTAALVHRPTMAWSVVAILLAGSVAHACSLGYIFDVPFSWADFLPFGLLASFLVLELLRVHGYLGGLLPACIAAAPVVAGTWVCLSGRFPLVPLAQAGFLWYPPAVVMAASLWVLWHAYRTRSGALYTVGVAGLLLVVLTAGAAPDASACLVRNLNWDWFASASGTALVAAGMLYGAIWASMAGAIVLSFAALAYLPLSFHTALGLTYWAAVPTMLGLTLAAVAAAFGRRAPRTLTVFAAMCLALGVLALDVPWLSCTRALWSASAVLAGLVLCYRTDSRTALVILVLPLGRVAYEICRLAEGWSYVIVGFALLATGATVALLRNGTKHAMVTGRR